MNYIKELHEEHREEKLIKSFQKAFPNAKIYLIHKVGTCLNLLFRNDCDEFLAEYTLTSFDCKLNIEHLCNMEYYYKQNKVSIHNRLVRNIYFDFMKKNFPNYKQDFLNTTNHVFLAENYEILI